MPDHLRDRADLIALVARAAPVPAARRAYMTGRIEVLGGFSKFPPGTSPGWGLVVTTKHGQVYRLAVVVRPKLVYAVHLLTTIPWAFWVKNAPVWGGDYPELYNEVRARACYDAENTCVST
jgi:hypothetical protein